MFPLEAWIIMKLEFDQVTKHFDLILDVFKCSEMLFLLETKYSKLFIILSATLVNFSGIHYISFS